ncbi:MAG: hypothetical protein NT076_00675 [Candidatus Pacearchaeota archaeon]|nr:hypothetical protein [Candidatus Pacearchaeota archaeon]
MNPRRVIEKVGRALVSLKDALDIQRAGIMTSEDAENYVAYIRNLAYTRIAELLKLNNAPNCPVRLQRLLIEPCLKRYYKLSGEQAA